MDLGFVKTCHELVKSDNGVNFDNVVETIAESFYYVKYGLSIIMSKSWSNNLTCVFIVFKTKRELKCQNEPFL